MTAKQSTAAGCMFVTWDEAAGEFVTCDQPATARRSELDLEALCAQHRAQLYETPADDPTVVEVPET